MIVQNLQKLMDNGEQPYAKVCTVHRVDTENKCCDVIPVDGSAELFDVPFHPDESDKGMCLYPAVNSHVLVVFINKHHACICKVSEVDLMNLKIDQTELALDKDGLRFQKEDIAFAIDSTGFSFKKNQETLKKLMNDLLATIQKMNVLTDKGPASLITTDITAFKGIQTRFNDFLKDA